MWYVRSPQHFFTLLVDVWLKHIRELLSLKYSQYIYIYRGSDGFPCFKWDPQKFKTEGPISSVRGMKVGLFHLTNSSRRFISPYKFLSEVYLTLQIPLRGLFHLTNSSQRFSFTLQIPLRALFQLTNSSQRFILPYKFLAEAK